MHVEKNKEAGRTRLEVSNPKVWPIAAVCEILKFLKSISEDQCSCICITTRPAEIDEWTKMLISSLKTKDNEARRVISLASDVLQNYIPRSRECDDAQDYDIVLLIVPRLA